METFSVGEVAYHIGHCTATITECEIVACSSPKRSGRCARCGELIVTNGNHYRVRLAGEAAVIGALPSQLRKKKPKEHPREETTTWNKCAWKPRGVAA